jgi:hypothetical protein
MNSIRIFFSLLILSLGCSPEPWNAVVPASNNPALLSAYCPNAKYLGTMMFINNGFTFQSNKFFSQYTLLEDARKKYGPTCGCDINKINVYNIRWDVVDNQRKSVIFDVFLCGS